MIAQYRPNAGDASILHAVTASLRGSVENWYGEGARLASESPEIRSYRNSFMLRYPVVTSTRREKNILVKLRRTPKMDSLTQAVQADIHQNVASEYESLQFVFDRIGDRHENFGAIRPLAYLEKFFAIVMEEYPSRTLRQLLDDQRSSRTKRSLCELKDAARKTGQWLYYFHHQIHTPSSLAYTTDDILQEVQAYAERIEFHSQGRVKARLVEAVFAERLQTIQIDQVAFSQSHADMSCDNVLYSLDQQICVIDIKTRLAPIYADLGLVLIHPDTAKLQIISGGRYYPEPLLGQYRAEIIAGYFEQEPGNEVLARIYSAVGILDKWLMYEELMHRYKGWKHLLSIPAGPFVSAYFSRLLGKYLDRIEVRASEQYLSSENARADTSV